MTEYKPNQSTQSEGSHGHHSHHHQHHHYRSHESTQFKNINYLSKKRRKLISNILFISLSIVAALIMIAVIWLYTVE